MTIGPLGAVSICCSIIAILILLMMVSNTYVGCPAINSNKETFVSFTTIPIRLNSVSFEEKTKEKISQLQNNQKLILNVPNYSSKGVKYVIPDRIRQLESDKFIINHCEVDEGPITKLLPTLRREDISEDDNIIIVDDDVHYKDNLFRILQNSIEKNPKAVSLMCNKLVMGYKGIGFKKKTMMGLLDVYIPDACRKIDDWILHRFIADNKIKKKICYYLGNQNIFVDLARIIICDGSCTINHQKHLQHALISHNLPRENIQLMYNTNRILAKKLCNKEIKKNKYK